LTLRGRMLLGMAYVLVLAIVAFEVPLALSLSRRVHAEVQSQARSQVDVLAATATDLLDPAKRPALSALVRRVAASVRGRVIVVDSHTRVLVDSGRAAAFGEPFSRPEIVDALRGRPAQLTRNSTTLKERILATTAPIVLRGRVAGAVRVTQSVDAADRAVRNVVLNLVAVGVAVLLVGLISGAVIARAISGPMRRLQDAAQRVATGDLGVRAIVEGSTEQRSLARSFNDMTERLARALAAQKQFVADASHQLRTPLAGLRLRLEEAQAAGLSEAAAVELAHGEREIDRLARTVDELLLLSGAGERDTEPEAVDPAEAAEAAFARWTRYAETRSIELALDPELATAPAVACSRADLDRAIDVLVENALQYSPAGTTVTLTFRPGVIEVIDEGTGLAPGEDEQVFERFRRGRAGRAGPTGSGLGLPIARELARRWGGDVTIANRPGGGAVASIELPLCLPLTTRGVA
jgi:two-component system, OmpR family, sensor kinase